MKKIPLAALALVVSGCATAPAPKPALDVLFAPDLHMDRDQIVVCIYIDAKHAMLCMSPEEFVTRFGGQRGQAVDL